MHFSMDLVELDARPICLCRCATPFSNPPFKRFRMRLGEEKTNDHELLTEWGFT